jgi:hypothetical protein
LTCQINRILCCVFVLFDFVLYDCQIFWIVHFWLTFRYYLTFILYQHFRTQNVMTHNTTTQKTKQMNNTDYTRITRSIQVSWYIAYIMYILCTFTFKR